MTWRTHLLAGFTSLWLLAPLPDTLTTGAGPGNAGLLALCAGVGALLPDLDASASKLGNLRLAGIAPFILPAALLHQRFGHRGLLHSLAGWGIATALVGLPLLLWLGWQPAAAFSLGYLSHIALDGSTKTGVPLLYPSPRRIWAMPPGLRVSTGTAAEDIWLAFLAAISLTLLLTILWQ